MAQDSKIEWTTHTQNLWWGCTKVHAGCDHCYAETLSKRWGKDVWGNDNPRRYISSWFKDLTKYQKLAKASGTVARVFVGSMMDIFEKPMPLVLNDGTPYDATTGHVRANFLQAIADGLFPNLMFLLLTKRPSNINKYIPETWKTNPPKNVMFGTSPCDQETANTLIPKLLKVNGNLFLSVEPLLNEIEIKMEWLVGYGNKINWVIVGGESGHGKRPFDADWARKIRFECNRYGVAFFMKQMDKVQSIPEDLMIREFPKN